MELKEMTTELLEELINKNIALKGDSYSSETVVIKNYYFPKGFKFPNLILSVDSLIFENCHFDNTIFSNITFCNCIFCYCLFNNVAFNELSVGSSTFKKCRLIVWKMAGTSFFNNIFIESTIKLLNKEFVTNSQFSYSTYINCNLVNFIDEFAPMVCPEKGSYIGYKKLRHGLIAELLIPEDAKRSSAGSRKCRASKAKVLNITSWSNGEQVYSGVSVRDPDFEYRIGDTVKVDNFDEDRWKECSYGIHHFMTKKDALDY